MEKFLVAVLINLFRRCNFYIITFLINFLYYYFSQKISVSLSLSLLFAWAIRLEFSPGLFLQYISGSSLGGVPSSPPPPPLPPPVFSSSLLLISSSPSLNIVQISFLIYLFDLALTFFMLAHSQLIYLP